MQGSCEGRRKWNPKYNRLLWVTTVDNIVSGGYEERNLDSK